MLQFKAHGFCAACSIIGQIYAQVKSGVSPESESWGRVAGLGSLERECQSPGLTNTLAQVIRLKPWFCGPPKQNVNFLDLARDVMEVQIRLMDELESRMLFWFPRIGRLFTRPPLHLLGKWSLTNFQPQ
jgi:hypothetical protein